MSEATNDPKPTSLLTLATLPEGASSWQQMLARSATLPPPTLLRLLHLVRLLVLIARQRDASGCRPLAWHTGSFLWMAHGWRMLGGSTRGARVETARHAAPGPASPRGGGLFLLT